MVQVEVRRKITAAAIVALTATLLAACGGENEGGEETTTESPVPSTGVAVTPPAKAAKCLQRQGFEAEPEDEGELEGEEGAEARLALTGPAAVPGSGRITYYDSEERAFEANSEELAARPPNSLIGRTAEAVYVFASAEDLEPARQAILDCL